MVAYLDSSAIVKLVLEEPETGPLREFLPAYTSRLSSRLARIEVIRASRRRREGDLQTAQRVLERLVLHPVDDSVERLAGVLDPRALRTLDAIHLATALILREAIGVFVSYDRRLLAAADAFGLPVAAPA